MPFAPLPAVDLEHIFVQTRELWEEARGRSFFITGGTGFFGLWLLESFAEINRRLHLGARAVVLSRDPKHFLQKAPHLARHDCLEFVTGDIRTFAFPEGIFPYLIHAAAEVDLHPQDPDRIEDTIVSGTRHVLDFAAAAGTSHFLCVSSGAAYGRTPPDLTHIPEDFQGPPASAYGDGKRLAEDLCSAHATKNDYALKIARCFAFVGPHLPLDGAFAIGNFLREGLAGGPLHIKGDGTPRRSYLYAADLAIWLWTLLFRGLPGRAYNVGSPHAISIAETAQEVAAAFTPSPAIEVALPPSGSPPVFFVPDVSRAGRELSLREIIPLQESIRRTLNWITQHS